MLRSDNLSDDLASVSCSAYVEVGLGGEWEKTWSTRENKKTSRRWAVSGMLHVIFVSAQARAGRILQRYGRSASPEATLDHQVSTWQASYLFASVLSCEARQQPVEAR